MLRLQRSAGNAAVVSLLRSHRLLGPEPSSTGPVDVGADGHLDVATTDLVANARRRSAGEAGAWVSVQRHSSFEHKLLGDVKPSTLQVITDVREFRGPPPKPYDERKLNVLPGDKVAAVKALAEQLKYLAQWQAGPPGPGTRVFHGVPVVTVKCEDDKAEVTCTIGEMNTLADYFGNPEQINHAKKTTLTGILQQVRQDTWGQLREVLGVLDPAVAAGSKQPTFAGSITSTEGLQKEAAIEAFTADGRNKASQTYLSNAGRNACHFAPQSWFRWKDYHEHGRAKASQAFAAKHRAKVKENDSLAKVSQDLANDAMVTNGFGDHYLQDSFAGGHLINKTLIMQWFVDWLGAQRDTTLDRLKGELPDRAGALIPEQSVGERWVKDWETVKNMTASVQPKLAGIDLYDRPAGGVARDPQTVEEQAARAERIKRAGITGESDAEKERNYSAYLAMLNNPLIQLASKVLHDRFCAEGLLVGANGTPIGRVFGDDHMMQGGEGVGFSAETAQMSQRAITDIVHDGTTDVTVESIMNRLPNDVTPPGGTSMISLKEWHTGGQLREFCESTIFPSVLVQYPAQVGLLPGGSLGKVSRDVPGGTGPSHDVQSKVKWVEEEITAFKKILPDFDQIGRDLAKRIDALNGTGRSVLKNAKHGWSGLKDLTVWAWRGAKEAAQGVGEAVRDGAADVAHEVIGKYEDVQAELPALRSDIEGRIEDLSRRLSEVPIPLLPSGDGNEMAGAARGGVQQGDASGGEF